MKAKKLGALLSPLLCAAFALGMAACGDNPSDSSSGGSHGNKGYYTYNTYMAGTNNLNWNPHTWETNDDSGLLGYMSMGFFDFVLAENKTSNARVPEMAAYVPGTQKLYEDVTASYAGSYGVGEGETAKAFRIYLNPAATWDDSKHTPIKAADYIYSMRQQLDPVMKNRRADSYYGGDFAGIQQKLPYLEELGVTCIYLNPIFEAHANHRYNTANYLKADPLLGTNEDFAALCAEAKKHGIRIILDGVFSHTGSDSLYFNREGRYGPGGAYRDRNSPYRSWYDFDSGYVGGYRSWWGFETLPEVNEETPSYVEFITGPGGVIDTWLRRGAAGFRLDVADELPDEFIEKVRAAVKRVSPEKFLLGEVWEDATTKFGFNKRRTYLLGKGLDSVMNYPFKNAVLDFVKGKPAEQAMTEILTICEHYPAPAMDTALNFLSTHDTERALTVIADEPANGRGRAWQSGRCVTGDAYEEGLLRLRMAYAIIYTLPGVPCLYYGDEIAMQGYRDPFNRAFFRWDAHEQRLRPVLAQLAQLRHTCEAFRTGQLRVLRAEGGILHYQRVGKVETAEIIVNRTEHIIVETLASGKSTEVNPMGFTIVVEEVGHNPNHSYYDYV